MEKVMQSVQAGRRNFARPLPWTAMGIMASLLVPAGKTGVVYVNASAPATGGSFTGSGGGRSWSSAFRSIQQALNVAHSGDEVWVAAGLYRGSITLRNGVGLYGGFRGGEALRSQRDWLASPTVLQGGFQGSVVKAGPDVRQQAVLDGFTIRDGEAETGGAISIDSASVLISHNEIVGNMADDGGALFSNGASYVTLSNNVIRDNHALRGGALVNDGGSMVLVNNTIVGNSSPNGGSIRALSGTVNAINNIIAYNRSGVIQDPQAEVVLYRNDIYGNGASDYLGPNSKDQWEVNMQDDPRLVNWADGSCHLAPGSPCIDTGDSSMASPFDMDLGGSPRRAGGGVDLGAYEYTRTFSPYRNRPAGIGQRG